MAWLLFHLHRHQDGNGWRSSRTWNHAAVSYCKYGKPCDPLVCCFDLCTAFWHCFCLACSPGRLACKLPYFLCGAQKITVSVVVGPLQFQLTTKNEIGHPFRGSLSHFFVGAILQQPHFCLLCFIFCGSAIFSFFTCFQLSAPLPQQAAV